MGVRTLARMVFAENVFLVVRFGIVYFSITSTDFPLLFFTIILWINVGRRTQQQKQIKRRLAHIGALLIIASSSMHQIVSYRFSLDPSLIIALPCQSLGTCSFWILLKLLDLSKLLHGFLLKLLHGFVKIDLWISINWFIKVAAWIC